MVEVTTFGLLDGAPEASIFLCSEALWSPFGSRIRVWYFRIRPIGYSDSGSGPDPITKIGSRSDI